jgi:hypothetical protein
MANRVWELWTGFGLVDAAASIRHTLDEAGLLTEAASVEPGFVGALLYSHESIAPLLKTAGAVPVPPSWSDEPFFRAAKISDDEWLAMPESASSASEAMMFEVVEGPEEPLLAYRGGTVDSNADAVSLIDRLASNAASVFQWRRRNRCMRPARNAECRADTCTGTCRSYSVLDGADILHLCSCTSS